MQAVYDGPYWKYKREDTLELISAISVLSLRNTDTLLSCFEQIIAIFTHNNRFRWLERVIRFQKMNYSLYRQKHPMYNSIFCNRCTLQFPEKIVFYLRKTSRWNASIIINLNRYMQAKHIMFKYDPLFAV